MRKRISADTRWKRFILLAIGLGVVYSFFSILLSNPSIGVLFGELVLIGVCAALYHQYDLERSVEFDDECMYITGKKSEVQVPLTAITRIKPVMSGFPGRNMWKIEYLDNENREQIVRISSRLFSSYLDGFIDRVKAVNNHVIIKSWTYSFDLDQ